MINISGVISPLSVKADLLPARSECGIGALMPWAGRLWMITYVSHKSSSGSGTGLYEIDLTNEFPSGFSAHWVRIKTDTTCKATAYFIYT